MPISGKVGRNRAIIVNLLPRGFVEHALVIRGITTARLPAEPIHQHLGFAKPPVAESCAVGWVVWVQAPGRPDGIDVNLWRISALDAALLGANPFRIEINPHKPEVNHMVAAVRILTAVLRGIRVAGGNVVTGAPKRSEDRKVSSVAITGPAARDDGTVR